MGQPGANLADDRSTRSGSTRARQSGIQKRDARPAHRDSPAPHVGGTGAERRAEVNIIRRACKPMNKGGGGVRIRLSDGPTLVRRMVDDRS